MKQRTELQSCIHTAPDIRPRTFSGQRKSVRRQHAVKQFPDFERSQLQIERSLTIREDSIMAVRKSLAAVDNYYRTICCDAISPPDDPEWESSSANTG